MTNLAGIHLFESVASDMLQRLERAATPMLPRDGTIIFPQGAPAHAVFAITGGDGCVQIGAADRNDKQLMVEVFRAGDVFGEIGVLDRLPRTACATVHGRVTMLCIPAATFLDVLGETPQLGVALSRALSKRLRRTFDLFQDATFETVEVRLARQLLYLADLGGRPVGDGVVLRDRFRQHDLANLLGATNRTIITILNEWRKTGLVAYDTSTARLTICDIGKMKCLIAEDD